jgi:diaminopimelate decarboxylase
MIAYKNEILSVEEMDLRALGEAVGTPCYVYSQALLHERAAEYAEAFLKHRIQPYFAVKANSNLAVLRLFAREGFGADIVSGGELKRALAAGIAPGKIVFSGVGKTEDELNFAIDTGIHQINIESEPELHLLSALAKRKNKTVVCALRIRPEIDAGGHDKISTGRAHDKFGVTIDQAQSLFALAKTLGGIALKGLAMHIGSQINDLAPFRLAYEKIAALKTELESAGYAIERLDLGGGYGIVYDTETALPAAAYADNIRKVFGDFKGEIGIEPGRALVGNAGILLTKILYVKESAGRRFIIIDAAMNDLIRPSLYDAWHGIIPVDEPAVGAPMSYCDIVGPVCETGDTFALDRSLPPVKAGDYLAILSAGAYGAVMSGTYNTRALVPEVIVRGKGYDIIRRRITADEQIAYESIPVWLA